MLTTSPLTGGHLVKKFLRTLAILAAMGSGYGYMTLSAPAAEADGCGGSKRGA
jgi:hypothetical protein